MLFPTLYREAQAPSCHPHHHMRLPLSFSLGWTVNAAA